MPIRHSVKALIILDGQILLNCCERENGTKYFDLPGGGQELYESREDTLHREVWEETGYQARPLRLAAVGEEIYTDAAMRAKYPNYTHRLFSIYLAEIIGGELQKPADLDFQTQGSAWFPLSELDALHEILPRGLKSALPRILSGETVALDTVYMDWTEDDLH